ncbi:MAG: type II toxin-antitoxin system VapC family toxin [Cyanobacteria bacterium P01_G01_bin.19]
MKLLLDTHIWLWYLQGNSRLSENLRQVMNSADTELWLSPISVWETIVLAEKGRIELDRDPQVWVKRYLRSLDLKEARITHEIAMKSRSIELTHQDPADRFIAATAIELDLTLATVDKRLLGLDWLSTVS